MTATSGLQLAVGARYAAVYKLNSNGRPAATGLTAYDGLTFHGPKAFTLNIPEPRKITHVGGDRVLAVDALPPTEAASGEIRVPTDNFDIDAVLTGTKKFTVAEASSLASMTDLQGSEPQVGLLLFQQSLDSATKLRRWRYIIIPVARIVPMTVGMSENPEDTRYMVYMSPTTKHLWGATMTTATEGATEAQFVRGMAEYKPHVAAWLADGTETHFPFATDKQAATITKVDVYVNGVLTSAGITVSTDKLTFTAAPTLNDEIVAFYEYV
jgi:hypothetical protein